MSTPLHQSTITQNPISRWSIRPSHCISHQCQVTALLYSSLFSPIQICSAFHDLHHRIEWELVVAQNPSKRWGELFFLLYTYFWLTLSLRIVSPYKLYGVRFRKSFSFTFIIDVHAKLTEVLYYSRHSRSWSICFWPWFQLFLLFSFPCYLLERLLL